MISRAIVEAPSLLFLGAGASKPYGKPLMGEFVSSFRLKVEGGRAGVFPVISRSPLLSAICEKREDLEFLIEELEALSSREYLENQMHDPNPPGVGGSPKVRWPDLHVLANEARNILLQLKREVYLEYRNIQDPGRTSVLGKIVALLRPASHPMVVFTTNYDPAVERFCSRQGLQLTDGFTHDELTQEYVWSRSAFDKLSRPSLNSLVLFKLHGSANWHRNLGRIIKGPPTYDSGDPDYQNVMIYPATRKVATEDPFFTAYDYLEQCLDKSTLCLVIGYSFRDYDTLMRFKSAKLSNASLTIAVLDPAANTICEYLESNGILATPLQFALGDFEPDYILPLTKMMSQSTSGKVGAP